MAAPQRPAAASLWRYLRDPRGQDRARRHSGRARGAAGALCVRGLEAMWEAARPGVAEYELRAAAAHAILAGGGEVDFLIVGSTPMAAPG